MPPNNIDRVRRPEVVLGELLRSYTQGNIANVDDSPKVLHRAVVLAVDMDGGLLSGPSVGSETVKGVGVDGRIREYGRVLGPTNPRGSIKAMIIDAARDSFYDEDTARILWPFFPTDQISLPIAPGEHVYTIFEDTSFEHGLWVCRISGHDGANFVLGADFYKDTADEQKNLHRLFDPSIKKESVRTSDELSTRVKPTKRKLHRLF